jgi:hypothetical protein
MIEDDSTDPRIERAVKEQLNKISKEKKENSGVNLREVDLLKKDFEY